MENDILGLPGFGDFPTWYKMAAWSIDPKNFTNEMMKTANCCGYPDVTDIGGLRICNAPLVGAWILAVAIGLLTANVLWNRRHSYSNTMAYSVTFLLYGLMISSGFIVHSCYLVECGAESPTQDWETFLLLDGSLTSCIAAMFFFNGLIDVGVILEKSMLTVFLIALSFTGIFLAYFNPFHWNIFFNVYIVTISIGCTIYVVCQIYCLIVGLVPRKKAGYLFGASVTGGVSFILFIKYPCWLCAHLGSWSYEGVWYYGSDVAMLCMALYAVGTRQPLKSDTSCSVKQ